MNVDGTKIRQLTTNAYEDDMAVLSPNGEYLAFYSDRDGDYEIFSMKIDGTEVRQLTSNPAGDFDPIWSPDGKQIVFSSDRYLDEEMFVMNSDGTEVVSLGVQGYPVDWVK